MNTGKRAEGGWIIFEKVRWILGIFAKKTKSLTSHRNRLFFVEQSTEFCAGMEMASRLACRDGTRRLFVKHPKAVIDGFPKLKERLKDEDQGVRTAGLAARDLLGFANR